MDGKSTDNNIDAKLISTIYQGYVRNRNKEIDRIDNSTGWSIGILVLMLSFMFTANVPFYLVPFSIIIPLPFWIKESRRYVYYMFWSHKESQMAEQIQHRFENNRYDSKSIIRVMDFKRPDKLININRAIKVRFYRSYFWMTVLIYVITLALAISQNQLTNNYVMTCFAIFFIIIIIIGIKGISEMIMPRKVIMHLGIRHDIKVEN
ncbi:MAG: DUF2270 domain-containing protein [Candidatus Aenigmarchaeota archaeon]|nr:DUF2270 domain-containing protein [Candidatus Aenigmarchaeota archaeon]